MTELTTKELFARLIEVETKFDLGIGNLKEQLIEAKTESKKANRQFQVYIFIMIVLLITNILVHSLGMI